MGCGERCGGCPLEKIGSGFTAVEVGARYEQTRLLLIGEASGEGEAQEGLPFRPWAQSGSLLADAMRQVNISRAEIAITNVIRCRPPGDKLEKMWYAFNAIRHCTDAYLRDVIEDLKPRVILALGVTAQRVLTTVERGRAYQLEYIRGFARPGAGYADGIPVISTWHPAHIRRGATHLTPLLQRDLSRAMKIALGQIDPILDPLALDLDYQLSPSLAAAEEFVDGL